MTLLLNAILALCMVLISGVQPLGAAIPSSLPRQSQTLQEDGGHLTFEGVEISGSVEQVMTAFRKQLKFKPSGSSLNDPVMRGKFGNDKVSVLFGTVPGMDLVYVMMLQYQKSDSFSGMQARYDNVRLKLSSLYGEPSSSNEDDPMHYLTVFLCPEGQITLTTSEDGIVRIFFQDEKNAQLAKSTSRNL